MRIVLRLLLIVSPCVLALALALFPPLGAQAANIVVTDSSATYPCSEAGFKQAVNDAGSGVVSFNCASSIITLTSPALISGVALVVDGANGGGAMTLSGGTTASIFNVGITATLTLTNLVLADGKGGLTGGAIHNLGDLRMFNLTCVGNKALAGSCLYNDGRALISGGHFENNKAVGAFSAGAALFNNSGGVMTVTAPVFTHNHADYAGGAVFNWGRISISGANFDSNDVPVTSGGGGGAIRNDLAGQLAVTGSSFSGNHAQIGGAIINTYGTANISFSAFAHNVVSQTGGAIWNYAGVVTVTANSTLTQNSSLDSGGAIWNQSGVVSVISSTISNNVEQGIYNEGTLVVRNSYIGYNYTYAFGGGIANVRNLTLDGSTLIGNLGYHGAGLYNVGTATVSDTTFLEHGSGSGGGAIANSGALTVTNSLIAHNSGQAVRNDDGTLLIASSVFSENASIQTAGALMVYTGSVSINHTTFYSNAVLTTPYGADGGAIYFFSGTVKVNDSDFAFNRADQIGGAIYNRAGVVEIAGSTFRDNRAQDGGAIYNKSALTLAGSTFLRNKATLAHGGAIDNDPGGTAVIESSHFMTNSATGNGGGINNSNRLEVRTSMFANNRAGDLGGGIANGTTLTVSASTFYSNGARYGGGLLNFSSATITNSTISSNTATVDGGGLYNAVDGYLLNDTVYGNTAGSRGGNLFNGIAGGVSFRNTIVAFGRASNCYSDTGLFISLGWNIDSDGTCGPAGIADQSGVNPGLGPLRDNGGPTWTHALLPNSPAIDRGNDFWCPPTDQRGVPRPFDGDGLGGPVCDIGAYELALRFLFLPLIRR